MTVRRRILLAAAGALLLPGCTSFADTVAVRDRPSAERTPEEPAPVGEAACPDGRAEPDPDHAEPLLPQRHRIVDGHPEPVGQPRPQHHLVVAFRRATVELLP